MDSVMVDSLWAAVETLDSKLEILDSKEWFQWVFIIPAIVAGLLCHIWNKDKHK